jgi:osmoprotectant transport system substrate-binding protein
LRSGQVQVGDLFSTDSRIKMNGFVPLRDDKNMFPAQNIVPLAAKGTLTRRQKDVLNRVSAALTTERLTKMDDQYLVQKLDPLDIAEQFLREAHLTRIIGR